MIVYQFAGAVRNIAMKDQGEAPVDSWMGWSSGHWEGNTLVVEVTGLNANWLDRSGNYATETRKVTERYTLTDKDHILYEATIEDPAVFSRPWTIRMPLYRRVEPNARLMDFRCVEFAEEMMYGELRKPGPPVQPGRLSMKITSARIAVAAPLVLLAIGAGSSGAADKYKAPRTSWGDPVIQGFYDNNTDVPFERARELGDKAFYTEGGIRRRRNARRRRVRADRPVRHRRRCPLRHGGIRPGSRTRARW